MLGGSGRAYACGGCCDDRYGPAGAREDDDDALEPDAAYCADRLVCDDDGDGAGEDDEPPGLPRPEPLCEALPEPLPPAPLLGSRSFERPDSCCAVSWFAAWAHEPGSSSSSCTVSRVSRAPDGPLHDRRASERRGLESRLKVFVAPRRGLRR